MRRGREALLTVLLVGLAVALPGCQSEGGPWTPPDEHRVKVVSDAVFVRTSGGDHVDGYLVESGSDFQKQQMFMAVEIPRYVKGDRLIISGRLSGNFVRMPSAAPAQNKVPVFDVEKAQPDIPKPPDIPTIKSAGRPASDRPS